MRGFFCIVNSMAFFWFIIAVIFVVMFFYQREQTMKALMHIDRLIMQLKKSYEKDY